jgi:hypothetical protein
MKSWSRSGLAALCVMVVVCLGNACKKPSDDRPRIVKLWGMGYIASNGTIASDGLEWFDFHEDGTVDSRTAPSSYQQGYWRLDQETHHLTLGEKGLDSLVYEYAFKGDTLLMEATMKANNHKVGICLIPIAKRPIEMAEEMAGF